ncbi:MAG: phosphogluconate dehydratase, partial [Altererythrobacter sp.]|nr:phosphogluconate dehydratase [Altererythrobacter sp.]
MSELNSTIATVTERVIEKSRDSRQSYLDLMDREADRMPDMNAVSCSNLAHAFAGAVEDQETLRQGTSPNIGIV